MKELPFRSLDEVIKKQLNKSGLDDSYIKAKIMKALQKIMEGKLIDIVILKKYDEGILVLKTVSPVWRYELYLRREFIRDAINIELKEGIVKQVEIL